MKIRAIKNVEVPIWENNLPTDNKETRVLVVFESVATWLGLKGQTRIGSMFLDAGITLEQANAKLDLDADYSKQIEFVAKPDSNFFRAVIK